MIKKKIKKIVEKAIKGLYPLFQTFGKEGIDVLDVLLEVPKEKTHGDYFTNVALVLSKKLNKNPVEVAKEIAGKIKDPSTTPRVNKLFEKVEVADPGFINFYLSDDFFIESFKKINKNFGRNNNLKNKKVIIEYTDPNILKEFHIGHLMSNSIGESLSRIIEWSGVKVKRVNYQGDVGLHVAKAIYGKIERPELSWQDAYVFGSSEYEKDEQAEYQKNHNPNWTSALGNSVGQIIKKIQEINKKIYDRSDSKINTLYDEGKKWSLEHFEQIYKKLDTKFDYYFFESQVADFGRKIVKDGLKKGIFIRGLSEKADRKEPIVFPGERFGLHTRVFINSEGLPTYEAKDLALPQIKYNKYKYDKSLIITASEQNDYFKVMLCALKEINPKLAEKTKHIGHGMMRLPEGKMSSRTGKVITFDFLLGEVEKLVDQKMTDRDFSEKEKNEVIEKVAIGALKYSILKQSIGSDIVYDFEKSISFEGDSGTYLQYSYARAQSVLRKAKAEKIKSSLKNIPNEISQLEKSMNYFPEVVEKAGKEYEPHFIVLYLTELAREFNNYYAKNKIVEKGGEYKVALTEAFSIIMKNGLWLLGINTLEKM